LVSLAACSLLFLSEVSVEEAGQALFVLAGARLECPYVIGLGDSPDGLGFAGGAVERGVEAALFAAVDVRCMDEQ
jgi:hypothetical protein